MMVFKDKLRKNKAIADRICQITKYILSSVDTPVNDNDTVDVGR